MSIKLDRKFVKKTLDEEDSGDEDSMIELGQIAILSSSKASLRYKSATKLNELSASQRFQESLKRKEITKRKDDENNKLIGCDDDDEDLKKLKIKDKDQNRPEELQSDDKEIEILEPDTWLENLKEQLLMFKGYGFGVLSAFSFCLSQVLMKRAKWLAGSDHSTIRYTVTLIIMITILKYKNMKIMGPRNQLYLLLVRGFLGSIGLITVYFALMILNPSDVVTLMHGSIIMTAILSRIFLKEKITIAHFIGFVLTVLGVIFISKPAVFFPHHRAASLNQTLNKSFNNKTLDCNKNATNCLPNRSDSTAELDFSELKPMLGVTLALCGSCASGIVYMVLKKLCNSKVHWATSTIYVCWFGLPVSILISIILISLKVSHIDIEKERKDLPLDIFYSVCASCLSVVGQIFLNISLRYEDATKIAITKTIDVFFSFILQYILLNIAIDLLGLLGACSILTGTFFVLIFKLLENKYQTYLKHKNAENSDLTVTSPVSNGESSPKVELKKIKKSKRAVFLKIIFFKI